MGIASNKKWYIIKRLEKTDGQAWNHAIDVPKKKKLVFGFKCNIIEHLEDIWV